MTSPADKDALVNRLQFTIDDGTLRERDGGCRTATDHEIALWNIFTAPAEAPVPTICVRKNSSGQIYLTNPDGTAFDISKHVNADFYAAPLPQSAPVSREAVIEECAKACEGEALVDNLNEALHRAYNHAIGDAAAAIRSLAANPAEPAGKGAGDD